MLDSFAAVAPLSLTPSRTSLFLSPTFAFELQSP